MLCAQMQCLKGAGICLFTAISAQMLTLSVEGEEGGRAEGWILNFLYVLQNSQPKQSMYLCIPEQGLCI